ncbi:MAG: hypothetical protein HC871_02505 [Rhizobiales bacterium]|nr:hypothetical protein [Hyphomicrobiales bacterium]
MKRFALAGLLVLSGCSFAPPVDPAAQAALNQWNAGVQTSTATFADQGIRRTPPVVGHWAEYRDLDADGTVSRRLQKVVGQEGDAYWLETESDTSSGGTTVKALVAMADWTRPDTMDIRRMISQPDGEAPQEVPALLAQSLAGSMMRSFSWTVTEGPIETVGVPAGRFEARVLSSQGPSIPFLGDTSGTAWYNAAVPVSGVVKSASANGYRSELVAFGETGATSSIPLP